MNRFIECLTLGDKFVAPLGLTVDFAALTWLTTPFHFGCDGA